jgi:hypothetical protein
MSERTIRLFSYGTLQLEAVQIANFGRRLAGAPDAMPGWRQTTIEITDPETIRLSGTNIHNIVAPSDDPADRVDGMVFEITEAELAAADAYEVADYKRVEVRLGSGLDAWVYVKA